MKPLFRETLLELRTPEGMEFTLPLAGPVSRMLATWIDILVVGIASSLLGKVFAVFEPVFEDFAGGLLMVAFFVLSLGYGIVAEWFWRGQTIGKRVMGIRVMDRDGLPMTAAQIVVRNLLRVVDMLPLFYMLGGGVALLSRYGQRIGDFAANTVVVRASEAGVPDIRQLFAGKFNSLLEYPHLAARLRQRVSAGLAGVALDALMRRETLDAGARVQVFGELAAILRGLVEFPAEAVDGLSDEQYVRNAVEIVYRSSR
ncbi:MAG: RDD family protein [Acidobacteria bacterium]|nr:RDD family protein [Acidobacteriota bacterium]